MPATDFVKWHSLKNVFISITWFPFLYHHPVINYKWLTTFSNYFMKTCSCLTCSVVCPVTVLIHLFINPVDFFFLFQTCLLFTTFIYEVSCNAICAIMNRGVVTACFSDMAQMSGSKNFTAACNTCKKPISGNVNNSYNFIKHIKVSPLKELWHWYVDNTEPKCIEVLCPPNHNPSTE